MIAATSFPDKYLLIVPSHSPQPIGTAISSISIERTLQGSLWPDVCFPVFTKTAEMHSHLSGFRRNLKTTGTVDPFRHCLALRAQGGICRSTGSSGQPWQVCAVSWDHKEFKCSHMSFWKGSAFISLIPTHAKRRKGFWYLSSLCWKAEIRNPGRNQYKQQQPLACIMSDALCQALSVRDRVNEQHFPTSFFLLL